MKMILILLVVMSSIAWAEGGSSTKYSEFKESPKKNKKHANKSRIQALEKEDVILHQRIDDIQSNLTRNISFNSGLIPDDRNVGYVNGRQLVIEKTSDTSNLRISYTDNFRARGIETIVGACTWEIRVNGYSCPTALKYTFGSSPH